MVIESFSDHQKWQLDQLMMEYWDAKSDKEKRHVELECYKLFKLMELRDEFIDYLNENGAEDLAGEMDHFAQIHNRVPHEHEKRMAA